MSVVSKEEIAQIIKDASKCQQESRMSINDIFAIFWRVNRPGLPFYRFFNKKKTPQM